MHFPPTKARASTEAVVAEPDTMPALRSSCQKESNHVVWILR
jgi:hypothetical protein